MGGATYQEQSKFSEVRGRKGYGRLHWALLVDVDPEKVRGLVLADSTGTLMAWRDYGGWTAVDWANHLLRWLNEIRHDEQPNKIPEILPTCEALLQAVRERQGMQVQGQQNMYNMQGM